MLIRVSQMVNSSDLLISVVCLSVLDCSGLLSIRIMYHTLYDSIARARGNLRDNANISINRVLYEVFISIPAW